MTTKTAIATLFDDFTALKTAAEARSDSTNNLASEAWRRVFDCERQIMEATPVDSNDLRIQGLFLVEDLALNEANMDVVGRFVTNAVRLAA